MKKLIYSLAVAGLALAACNEFDDETSVVYPEGPSIEASIEAQGDSAVSYTVTASAQGTHHFVYALVEGSADDYSADDVVSASGSVVAMVDEFQNDTVKIGKQIIVAKTVKSLAPNTTYSIVAVAYSSDDKPGKVAHQSATTSDGLPPVVKKFEIASDTVVVVTFSEAVKIDSVDNFSKFSAALVKPNESGVEVAKLTDVVVSGEKVSFYVEGARPGLFVSVGWEEGAVMDLAGLPAEALEVGFDEENLYDQYPAGKFVIGVSSISCEGVFESYADKDAFALTLTTKQPVFVGSGKAAGSLGVTFSVKSDRVSATVSSEAEYVNDTTLRVYIPEEVLVGQKFSISLDSAAIQDAEGNYNKQLTLISSDTALMVNTVLPLSAALGSFDVAYYLNSEKGAVRHSEEWTVADAGESEGYEYLVSVSGITFGYVNAPKDALGIYNSLTHYLSILSSVGTFTYKGSDVDVYLVDYASDGEEDPALEFTAPGNAVSTGAWKIYLNGLGTLDYVLKASAVRK
ncbi:MAG: hypothetical protein ACI35Q_00060 [Marinilabiliaceae bacterium]